MMIRARVLFPALISCLTVAVSAEEAVWTDLAMPATAERAAALRARMAEWHEKEPTSPEPWLKQSGIRHFQRDSAAAATLREGLEALPGNVTLRCRLAGCLVSGHDVDAASHGERRAEGVRIYHSLLTECADPQETLAWAGELFRTTESGQSWQEIADWAEVWWRTSPDDPLRLAVAVICQAENSGDGLNAWLAGHPDDALLLQVAGWCEHTRHHRPDNALPLLRRAETLRAHP